MLKDNYWDDFEERFGECVDGIVNKKDPILRRLTVHITDSCNFRCKYCNMNFKNNILPKNTVLKIINEFKDMGGGTIHFTGGEPTIVPYYEYICEYAKKLGLTVSSNSNAYKKVNTRNIDKFKVSFDSYEKEYTDLNTGILGSFEKIVENMKQYSEEMEGKVLSITAVLNKQTFRNMKKLAEFVEKEFSVYNLYFSNYKGCNEEFSFTDEEIDEMFEIHIPETLEFFKEIGAEYSYKQLELYNKADFKDSIERFECNKTLPCYIQLSEMTIDTMGYCHNCSHNFRDGYTPYSVRYGEYSLSECFKEIKKYVSDLKPMISKFCLSGCNCNLIGFNKAVDDKLSNEMELMGDIKI